MKLGIMQPYFFPYLGYWQLMNAVDKYVIYDNIEFTKSGWIRRNRLLAGGTDKVFSLPLKKDSDYLDIRDRFLADSFETERKKLVRLVEASYKKAPMFDMVFPLIEDILACQHRNLFDYIFFSVCKVKEYLGIDTPLVVSSGLDIDASLRGKDRVLATCRTLDATEYYNAIGGLSLYEPYRGEFEAAGIQLRFLKTREVTYPQFKNEFVPNLSIIDVMMFNSQTECQRLLREFDLIG